MFPWTKVIDAHKEMEANKNSGKVSLGICAGVGADTCIRLSSRSQNDRYMHQLAGMTDPAHMPRPKDVLTH